MGHQYKLHVILHHAIDADKGGMPSTLDFWQPKVRVEVHAWDDIHKQHVVFTADGFESEAAARENAERLWQTIVLGLAHARTGVLRRDLTLTAPGHMGSVFSQAHARAGLRLDQFLAAIAKGAPAQPLTERQTIAALLISDSLLLANPDAQFVMRVFAVEALCDQGKLSTADKAAMDNIIAFAKDAGLSDSVRVAVLSTMSNIKGKSIGKAYRDKIEGRLGATRRDEFAALYTLRSEFVHDGRHRGKLGDHADAVLQIALDLLAADIATP